MMAISAGRPVASSGVGGAGSAFPTTSRAPLPSAEIAGPADYQDAMLLLMRADLQQGAASKLLGRAEVDRNGEAVKTFRKKEAQALAEQQKTERDSRGFWAKLKKFAGTVAKIAAVVAAVAGSVFTGGASLVAVAAIVAVGLSAGATVVRETQMFGKLSDKIGLGMEITGAVIGVAAGGAGALQTAQVANQATTIAKATASSAEVVGAAATATGAAAGGVVAGYQHDADIAAANGEDARGRMQIKEGERQAVIDWLAQVSKAEVEATDGTTKAIEGCNQAANVAIAGVRA